MIEVKQAAPELNIVNQDNEVITLDRYQGKNIVLYFYPKDNTPGCTTEGKEFTALKGEFEKNNTIILGVSKDSVKKHQNFIKKQEFSIDLLSDEDGDLCERYGVWVLKKMYGREYMGIERATFLIDQDGIIQQIWHKVKVKGHVDDVLNAVINLKS